MVVISKSKLSAYTEDHSDVADALNQWYLIAKSQNWKKFSDVKLTFNSVDSVGNDHYVFNIKGNHYRLITMIHFNIRTIYIRFIGTHSEYDQIDCSTI